MVNDDAYARYALNIQNTVNDLNKITETDKANKDDVVKVGDTLIIKETDSVVKNSDGTYNIYEDGVLQGVLTINNNGRGKITKLEDFSSTSRGARGYVIQKIEEGESISAIQAIRADSTKVNVIAGNKLTSMAVSEIPSQGRVTSGISLINAKGANTNIYIIQE